MKGRRLLRAALLLAVGCMASCTKDDISNNGSDGGPGTPSLPSDDGTKRIVQVDDLYYRAGTEWDASSSYYSVLKITWENGKAKRWAYYDINDDLEYYNDFIYEGGRLAAMKVYTPDGSLDNSFTFQYDGDRPTRVYEGEIGTYTYDYNAAGELVKRTLTSSYGYQRAEELTWENGNVAKVVEWYDGNIERTLFYSYDDKPSMTRQVCGEAAYIVDGLGAASSRNNVVEFRELYPDGSEYTRSQDLTYDGDYVVMTKADYEEDGCTTQYIRYSDGTSATLPTLCTITADCNATDGDCYVSGGGVYAAGSQVTLYASEGYYYEDIYYSFERWSDGVTENIRSLTATTDAVFHAIYAASK